MESRRTVVAVAVLVVGTALGLALSGLGTAMLLLPTVVVLHLVYVRSLAAGMLAVAVVLAGGVLVGVPDHGSRGLLAVVLFTVVHTVAVAVFREVRERTTPGGPVEVAAWLAATVVPVLVHRTVEAAVGLPPVGVLDPTLDAGSLVRGDLLGLVGLGPVVVALARGRHHEVAGRAWALAAVLALVTPLCVLAAGSDPNLVALVAVPPVVASLWLGRAPTMAVSAVVAGTVAWVAGSDPVVEAATLQVATVTVVAAAVVLAALRSPASVADPVAAPAPIPLTGTSTRLVGVAGTRARLIPFLRRLRVFNATVLLFAVAAVAAGWWPLDPAVPSWLVAAGSVLPVLGVNALSRHLDRSRGHTDTRELLEVLGDTAALVVMTVPVAAFIPGVTLYTSMLWVTTMAVLRLPPTRAALVAGGYAAIATGVAVAGVAPIPIAPDLRSPVLALTALAPLLPGMAVVWLLAIQRDAQSRAEASAVELDALQQRLRHAEAAARAEHRQAAATAASRARAIEQLHATNEEVERSRAGLERFASVVAHDLRSPLGTARMALDLSGELPADEVRAMTRRGLDRAIDLLDSIYRHSQVATAPLALALVDLGEVIEGTLFDVHERVMQTGAVLAVDDAHPDAICDAVLVGQVLTNLLNNAMRYAGDGRRPMIEVTAVRDGDGVVVTVADDGPGIPEGAEDALFSLGVQLHPESHAGVGLGLGLATCRDIVQRHGGRIWTTTSRLGGAAFSFRLPDRHLGVSNVLVVEDDPDLQRVYAAALTDDEIAAGCVVLPAGDLRTARHLLQSVGGAVDAVLLDLDLPDGRSDELVDELVRLDVPVHVVTELRPDMVGERIRAAGFPITSKQDLVQLRGRSLRDQLLAGTG